MTSQGTRIAKISERGCGMPDVGEMVWDGSDNSIYKIVRYRGGIQTAQGSSNWKYADVVYIGDPSDISEEAWEALPNAEIEFEDEDEDEDDEQNP